MADTSKFVVVYVGAPYGENEVGEIVSRHATLNAAILSLARLQQRPRYYGSNATVKELQDGQYRRTS